MKNTRSYYSGSLVDFLYKTNSEIIGDMALNNQFDLNELQVAAWDSEITILKEQLAVFDEGRLILEYTIPRMGKRIDTVFLHRGIVFLLEFKIGDQDYRSGAFDQVMDYALDLKNFQKESHDKLIIPIAVPSEACARENTIFAYDDRILKPLGTNKSGIADLIRCVAEHFRESGFDYEEWENSAYLPTPTIIEAAQALYANHSVEDITRADAGAQNLTATTSAVKQIISYSKNTKRKSIVFVTGVPGAGKTLVGLNLANEFHNNQSGEHAVFLSGNQPLVTVLQEALARDKVVRAKKSGERINKKAALREVFSFIQIIHRYRDDYVGNDRLPTEKIAIFDESQRAWTTDEISTFMARKKGIKNFKVSEPEFLIGTMDRFRDWAVIVCLVGGGQEINSGEAGMPEWFDSLRRSFSHWDVYTSKRLNDLEYTRGRSWLELTETLSLTEDDILHLATSMRSFRNEHVSDFVKALLDRDIHNAREHYRNLCEKYPIVLTRSIEEAKKWVGQQARGSERYGLLSSSSAARLKPHGIYYAKDRNNISPESWFLNGKDDIRSSYFLEVVASEFETQGLELDFSIVAWDADLRMENGSWGYYSLSNRLSPPNWSRIRSKNNIIYLINAYRVLLTRARQGFVVYIPEGSMNDITRKPECYDGTYTFFKQIGIKEI